MRRCLLLPWLLAAAALPAAAQTVYRCGPEGRDYRQLPCPGGQALDAADSRSEAQRQEAERQAQRDAALAGRLRQAREAQEKRAAAAAAPQALPRPVHAPARENTQDATPPPRKPGHARKRRALPPDTRVARAKAAPAPAAPASAPRPVLPRK